MVHAWLVFFGPAPPGWWSWVLHPQFQHVCAAGCDPETRTWVFFDPERVGTQIEVLPYGDSAEAKLGIWAVSASHVLRFVPRRDRALCPPMLSCTGAVKALLGISALGALAPRGLYRHLLAHGAEIIPVPRSEICGEPVQAGPAEGRPKGCRDAAARAAAR